MAKKKSGFQQTVDDVWNGAKKALTPDTPAQLQAKTRMVENSTLFKAAKKALTPDSEADMQAKTRMVEKGMQNVGNSVKKGLGTLKRAWDTGGFNEHESRVIGDKLRSNVKAGMNDISNVAKKVANQAIPPSRRKKDVSSEVTDAYRQSYKKR